MEAIPTSSLSLELIRMGRRCMELNTILNSHGVIALTAFCFLHIHLLPDINIARGHISSLGHMLGWVDTRGFFFSFLSVS